jgi:hypothetical protein
VDRLDDPRRPATSAQPEALTESEKNQLIRLGTVVSIFASWNQLDGWLRQIQGLRTAASYLTRKTMNVRSSCWEAPAIQ